MKKTKVLIVGAGPAGSVCGNLLLQAGIGCIVIDRATFPREKLCGGGLTPKCYQLLEELIPGFRYDYNTIRKIKITVDGKHTCAFDLDTELRVVKRKDFDNLLLNAFIDAGGTFMKDAFDSYEERPDGLIVTLKSGEQVACDYLVGADGTNSAVRRQLTGRRDDSLLVMEQFVERSPDNAIAVELSRRFDTRGYFYRFPNGEFDAVGYGDDSTTPEGFRKLLRERGIAETRLRGCYIYMKTDYPLKDRIILIGDAGGFANRVTCEGIKDAFITARNAAEAIKNGRPFREVNGWLFNKMKKEDSFCKLFYHPLSIWLLGQMCRFPSFMKRRFEKALRSEGRWKNG